eukprot:gene575-854_t
MLLLLLERYGCHNGTLSSGSPCVEEATLPQTVFRLTASLCGSTSVRYEGVSCGPNNALIQWNKLKPGSRCQAVDRAATARDLKKQADWLGQCGVPPYQIKGIPTRVCGRVPTEGSNGTTPPPNPPPGGGNGTTPPPNPPPAPSNGSAQLPIVPVLPGEASATTLWGMSRIGTYNATGNTVVDISAAMAESGMKVVVMDTGIEMTHPDLNVVDFVDLVNPNPGDPLYKIDGNGHGTHVAGTIAAKNNGRGVYGVVPGMALIAYKVLSDKGSGSIDTSWNAYRDILTRLKQGEKIVAINLSLGAITSDASTRSIECEFVKNISDYGVAVVVAAGNENNDLDTSIPGACPGGYAKCFLGKFCKLSSNPDYPAATTHIPVMQAAARSASCSRCPQFGTSRFYGYVVNVRN